MLTRLRRQGSFVICDALFGALSHVFHESASAVVVEDAVRHSRQFKLHIIDGRQDLVEILLISIVSLLANRLELRLN